MAKNPFDPAEIFKAFSPDAMAKALDPNAMMNAFQEAGKNLPDRRQRKLFGGQRGGGRQGGDCRHHGQRQPAQARDQRRQDHVAGD